MSTANKHATSKSQMNSILTSHHHVRSVVWNRNSPTAPSVRPASLVPTSRLFFLLSVFSQSNPNTTTTAFVESLIYEMTDQFPLEQQPATQSGYTPAPAEAERQTTYAEAITDMSVPAPVAAITGVATLTNYNGFEHNNQTFLDSPTVTACRRSLHKAHCRTGSSTAPSPLSLSRAVIIIEEALTEQFKAWFPHTADSVTADEMTPDTPDIYDLLVGADVLNYEQRDETVVYARGPHRELIVSAIAIIIAAVDDAQTPPTTTATARADLVAAVREAQAHLSDGDIYELVAETVATPPPDS